MPRQNKGPRLRFIDRRAAFYICWYEFGQQRLRATGTSDRDLAEQKLADFIRERGIAVPAAPVAAERPSENGFVYFIRSTAGPIKIGYTTDPERRLAQLRKSSPVELEMAACAPGTTAHEWHYQNVVFPRERLHGEWFEPSPRLLAEIERIGGPK